MRRNAESAASQAAGWSCLANRGSIKLEELLRSRRKQIPEDEATYLLRISPILTKTRFGLDDKTISFREAYNPPDDFVQTYQDPAKIALEVCNELNVEQPLEHIRHCQQALDAFKQSPALTQANRPALRELKKYLSASVPYFNELREQYWRQVEDD